MKKTLPTLGALVASAFYVAWPAYSGYQIRDALEMRDEARLSDKVDFPSVRASLTPIVAARLEIEMGKLLKQAGPLGGLLTDEFKAKAVGQITERIINVMVTPEMLIRVHEQGGNFKETLDKLIRERARQADALGSLFNKGGDEGETAVSPESGASGLSGEAVAAGEPQAVAGKPGKRKFDVNNIKSAGLDGPLAVHLSVARDPKASDPDITVRFHFTGSDWKLAAIEPKL